MAITLAQGKIAVVKIGNTSYTFSEWRLQNEGDELDADHFGIGADVDGGIRHQKEIGMLNTTVELRARWNTAAPNMPNVFYPGAAISGLFLGVTDTVGYTVTGIVKGEPVDQSVRDAANFSVSIHVNHITATPWS